MESWESMIKGPEVDYNSREMGERIGRQQVYNALLSLYLDAREAEARSGRRPTREDRARRNGQGDALTWAAKAAFDLWEDEAAVQRRIGEDLEERLAARAD